MNREEIIKLIESHVANKNIIKHMVALEAVMGALWEKFKTDGTEDEWKLAGLLGSPHGKPGNTNCVLGKRSGI
jgi:predicted hydrolase (HD superfamily)